MRARNSKHDPRRDLWRAKTPQAPAHLMAAVAVTTGGALLVLSSHLPLPLVLPVVSVLLLIGATGAGWIAWRQPQPAVGHPSYWDVSGALALASIGAALLSEPEAVLPLL